MWLIYALGGGWGHLTRAIALARIAQRGRPLRILTNSPYAGIAVERDLDVVALDTRAGVVKEIAECAPECLIVDTFPRGIGGELISTPKARATVLVHRDINPRYVESARLREIVAARYDLVLVPGAGEGSQLGNPPPAITTDPWLVRCAGELSHSAPIEGGSVLVCASGKPEELKWYGTVIAELLRLDCPAPVRCAAAECPPDCPKECWVRYWPAIDLVASAAVVIGGAGYNTVAECLALGVPLVARPWPRMYDRQELRAQRAAKCGHVIVVNDPREAARAAIAEIGRPPRHPPPYSNGAIEAVARIEALFRSQCAHRIDARSAPDGKPCGKERNPAQQERDHDEDERV